MLAIHDMPQSELPQGMLSTQILAHQRYRAHGAAIGALAANGADHVEAAALANQASFHAQRLGNKLDVFGLDVQTPLALGWYNRALPEGVAASIPERGDAGADTFALLVGNTKQIWEPFVSACSCHQQLMDLRDPLDAYVERSVEAVLHDALPGVSCRVYYGHRKSADVGGHVALQRMAHAVGLAHLDEASHLCLHPKYGSWFSLRCVLVFDGVRYTGTRPAQLANPLDASTRQYISLAVSSALHSTSCDLGIAIAEEEAKQGPTASSLACCSAKPPSGERVRSHWQKWAAIRDAPCAGHPWRFSKHQLAYHYTADRDILRRLVAFAGSPRDAPERLAVELELPGAAMRRRSRERSRSGSGDLPAVAAFMGSPPNAFAVRPASVGTGAHFSPSRRAAPILRAISRSPTEDEECMVVPQLARDSMGSNASDESPAAEPASTYGHHTQSTSPLRASCHRAAASAARPVPCHSAFAAGSVDGRLIEHSP